MQFSFALITSILAAVAYAAPAAEPAAAAATNTGRATYTDVTGVGSCGVTSDPSQLVATVSTEFFSTYPGATANPNKNPLCKKSLKVTYQGKTVTAKVVDQCTGCGQFDIGLSKAAFNKIDNIDDGSVTGIKWQVV